MIFFSFFIRIQSHHVRHKRSSPVWLAFDLDEAQREAQCKFCLKTVTITRKGPSSNLKRHLRSNQNHIDWYANFCNLHQSNETSNSYNPTNEIPDLQTQIMFKDNEPTTTEVFVESYVKLEKID